MIPINKPATTRPNNHFNQHALVDLLSILAVLVVVKQTLLPISFLYAGPASTFSAMAIASYLLRRRGLRWHDLGFKSPTNWWKTWLLTLFTFLIFALSMQLMGQLAEVFFEKVGDSGRFNHIEGNLSAYMIIMFFTWTHASFFEELLFRAFIINRTSAFLGGGIKADIIAAIFSAVFFGYRHFYYQGFHGALTTGAAGLALALLYLWFGRHNILPLILSHGLMNSIGQTFRYLGIEDD